LSERSECGKMRMFHLTTEETTGGVFWRHTLTPRGVEGRRDRNEAYQLNPVVRLGTGVLGVDSTPLLASAPVGLQQKR